MEIDNAIFQDVESFGKERFFKMAVEKFWIFLWEDSSRSWIGWSLVLYRVPKCDVTKM